MASPRGTGTVYKESDAARTTRWRAEKHVRLPNGTRRRLVARGATQKEALANLALRERAAMRASPSAANMTVKEYLARWLKKKSGLVRPSTLAEYERIVAFVNDGCGHFPLANLQPYHLQEVIDAAIARRTPGTAAAIRRYMYGAFQQAQQEGLLYVSPAAELPKVWRPDPVRLKWEPEEAERFLTAAREHAHAGYQALFYTALLTGMRKGELMALRWSDVKPTSVLVRASASRHAKGGVSATKTASSHRRVPITESAYETISELRARMPESVWALPNEAGNRFGERNILRTFHRVIALTADDKVKPPVPAIPQMRFHDLRRTTATWWAAAGVPPKVIQRLLGHSTPRLALEVYTDVLEGQVEGAALDPERWLGGGTFGGSKP